MALTTRLPANQFPFDFALRMSQTTTSVLPFDLVARIIKEADGGLNAHKKKFKSVLNFVELLKYYPHDRDNERCDCETPFDISAVESELPTLFPPVSWCTQASGELRDRERCDMELDREGWWCPGGGGDDMTETSEHYSFQPRFQAYLFH